MTSDIQAATSIRDDLRDHVSAPGGCFVLDDEDAVVVLLRVLEWFLSREDDGRAEMDGGAD